MTPSSKSRCCKGLMWRGSARVCGQGQRVVACNANGGSIYGPNAGGSGWGSRASKLGDACHTQLLSTHTTLTRALPHGGPRTATPLFARGPCTAAFNAPGSYTPPLFVQPPTQIASFFGNRQRAPRHPPSSSMATKEEIEGLIKAKGDEIRQLKADKAEKDVIMAQVAGLNVRRFVLRARKAGLFFFPHMRCAPHAHATPTTHRSSRPSTRP